MTLAELKTLCTDWQKRLRLQDWKVDLRLVRHFELNPNTSGDINPVLERREAVINVLVAEDRPDGVLKSTEEQTLVHELLHMHFEPFWRDDKRTEMEQAINALADAFVSLKNEGNNNMTTNELEVAPGVYAASSRISINDKGEYGIHHNGAEITMTKDEFRFFVTMGRRIINGDVEPMPCTCGENQGCTSCP